MFMTALASAAFKLALMLIGIALARLALVFFDAHVASSAFHTWLETADDLPRALYFGLRFLAICIAVGLILG